MNRHMHSDSESRIKSDESELLMDDQKMDNMDSDSNGSTRICSNCGGTMKKKEDQWHCKRCGQDEPLM
jgi:ribosomal protein S27AE